MGNKSGIEWTDATWNPVTGCSKVSAGCKHCYAERDWARLSANPKTVYYGRKFTDVRCHPERLWENSPGRWEKPRRVFVNSMSDLFHPDVPFEFIDDVFEFINCSPMHIFQILTKRPERMLEYFARYGTLIADMDHVWLGVSVEDQAAADERIPLLLESPAAVRWISAEPLLGPVDLSNHLACMCGMCGGEHLDWVVVGGESGPKARPMHPQWARDLRDQCAAASVPFLFKQWGEWAPHAPIPGGDEGGDLRRGIVQYLIGDGREFDGHFRHGDAAVRRVGKKAAGRLLDGNIHNEYPRAV